MKTEDEDKQFSINTIQQFVFTHHVVLYMFFGVISFTETY